VYARMATFEGDPAQIKEVAETIGKESEAGPPEGVPGKEFLLLTGRDSGKMVGIVLFETEADLPQGHETLNAMSPPAEAESVGRVGVELFEVAVHAKA
jgi:hypothetical protein